jgi:cytoskeletal protein CcmA (bactofilin family)
MFGKNTDSTGGERYGQSILQEGVAVRGDLQAKGDVRMDGEVDGKLIVGEKLTIGPTGNVRADVEAGEVVVMGTIRGTVRAVRRLELRKGAHVSGDITTPVLVIEEGVYFHGRSNMQPEGTDAERLSEAFAEGLEASERFTESRI